MTLVNIDLRNQGYETGTDDRVIFYSLLVREGDFGTISTAPVEVELVEGKATVDLAPGPVGVQIIARQVADTRIKIGEVPPSGPTTLNAVMMVTPAYTPALQKMMIAAVERAKELALTKIGSEVTKAVSGEVGEFKTKAEQALVKATAADSKSDTALSKSTTAELSASNAVHRVEALEVMGGLTPGEPADGQTANLLLQPESLSRAALNQSYVSTDLTVSVADPRFGAVADWDGTTGTDNTAAIRAAISHARSLGMGAVLLYPHGPGRGYYVSQTIDHGPDLSVHMRVPIYHPGGAVTVRFGSTSKLTNSSANYVVRVVRSAPSDWTDQQDTGFEMINIARCNIDIPFAYQFTTLGRLIGDGAGFVTCNITLGQLGNGQTALNLHNRNNGWTNSNVVIGGYVLNTVGLNRGKPRRAISYTSESNVYNDGNVFLGLTAELKVDDALGAEVEIVRSEHGQLNIHQNIRSETSGSIAIRNLNDSRFNDMTLTYSQIAYGGRVDNSQAIRDTGRVTELRTTVKDTSLHSIWCVDEIHKKAAMYSGATNVHVPGVSWRSAGNPNVQRHIPGPEIQENYLRIAPDRAAGVNVSTEAVKRLVLSAHTAQGSPGRWVIKAFREDGTTIRTPGAVKQGGAVSLYYNAIFDGCWLTGTGTHGAVDFSVSDEVSYIWVGLGGDAGKAALVTGIEVLTNNPLKSRVWQPWDDRGMNWGTTAPTAGAYQVGRTVMNAAPAPGQPLGWVCTAAGSPGTWVPMQSLPSA